MFSTIVQLQTKSKTTHIIAIYFLQLRNIFIIHKHSFAQIEFTCSLMFHEFLLQFKANFEISCL
jgi:hypothetical protein